MVLFVGAGPDGAAFRGQCVDVDLGEFLREVVQRATKIVRFQARHEQMTGADLGFAKEERGIMPAPIEQIDDRIGDARHVGFVLTKAIDHAGKVRQQACPVELVMIDREAEIVAFLLQDMKQPVRKLDVAIAGALCVAQGLYEGIIAGPVQLARYSFNADVGHGGSSCLIHPRMPGIKRKFHRIP